MVPRLGGLGTIAGYHSCSLFHSNLDRTNVFSNLWKAFEEKPLDPCMLRWTYNDVLANRVTVVGGKGQIIYCRWDCYM